MKEGWAHVHENVSVDEVEPKQEEVVGEFRRLVAERRGGRGRWEVQVDGVFKVKTYAPGVVHVVFDVRVYFVQDEDAVYV